SSNITIRQCCMRDGHGSITLGSEMAGGVKNLRALDCVFLHTDRGLRIKTRRGRGKDAVIDGILFEHIKMDHVMTPFVINSFYFCDKDGHTDYVQCKEDRKSTRLNSSHVSTSYAVFCLKKKSKWAYGTPSCSR